MTKLFCVLILWWGSNKIVWAQTQTICGQVKAFNHYPLRNVEIKTKKSKQFILTDSLGNFCIKTLIKDKITFTAKGFIGSSITLKNSDPININMIFIDTKKNRELVLENNNLTEKELDFALTNYMNENNDFSNYSDIFKLIEAKVMGVSINNNSVTIMGNNSSVLYEVDGVISSSIAEIPPVAVKSFELLKPDEATIYGIRGANGVLKIKTQ